MEEMGHVSSKVIGVAGSRQRRSRYLYTSERWVKILVMMEIDKGGSSIFFGFVFVSWESNRGEGETRSEENGGE